MNGKTERHNNTRKFKKWLDKEHRYSLQLVTVRWVREFYTIYDEKTKCAFGSCRVEDRDKLVAWAKERISQWRKEDSQ